MRGLFKKGFDIQLEDSLHYPSSDRIRKAIAAFCTDDGQKYEFINGDGSVIFKLNSILYEVTVNTSRGGYFLHCKEV
ncbi:DUF4318 domain-containing protein [Caproiciproducens sp.]|uniref:DUF4318 domain-containing protein n=1 Tax=Caproiciproducens sp. TaxID=1954376 RepID=UPI00289FEC73|nr:DUF4318 domain-containing protein [Caproiciproducens sp.]